ncbi:hypothetical protein [Streptomyces aidingensis]|uniref:Uncharacterized protein n=1 Tax=Streptomyces aidingensis TaxID=910347 RepID=A0A1I1LNK8_9ACTN|nr:hypothetical protein [Streptomyces aidingensis]SFC74122.1 hypothetical protein SAMN05421773_105302 [Streptomyces aidingensis]
MRDRGRGGDGTMRWLIGTGISLAGLVVAWQAWQHPVPGQAGSGGVSAAGGTSEAAAGSADSGGSAGDTGADGGGTQEDGENPDGGTAGEDSLAGTSEGGASDSSGTGDGDWEDGVSRVSGGDLGGTANGTGALAGTGGEPFPEAFQATVVAPWMPCASVHETPWGGSPQTACLPDGTTVWIRCTAEGEVVSANGVTSTLWNRIDAGYLPDVVVYTGSNAPVMPGC